LTARRLPLIARRPSLVASPGAGVTARRGRARPVAFLAEAGRLARATLAAKVLAAEVLAAEVLPVLTLLAPVPALLARLRRGGPAEPAGRVLRATLPLVAAARTALGRRPRDRGIVHLVARPVGERCGG
jgi:hypothetical protein